MAIRALGVLAISLMAMTSSLASSAGVPTCEQVCDKIAWTDCQPLHICRDAENSKCIPWNVSRWCFDNCEYTWYCDDSEDGECVGRDGPGFRMECSLRPPPPGGM